MKFSVKSFSIKTFWKRAGKVVRALLIALAVYLILLVAAPASTLTSLAGFVTSVLSAWIAFRWLRIGFRKLTWRLRNRLVIAYLFIAVLPILLVIALVGLGAYILAGQMAVYMVRSELDRRVAALQTVAEDAGMAQEPIEQIGERNRQRFPGLILWTARNGVFLRWPADADGEQPAKFADNSTGYALRDGRYYAWANVAANGKQAVALCPLSRQYLTAIVPGLGDVYFVQLGAGDLDSPRLVPAGGETAATSLPPAVNRFDVAIRWGSLMRAADWAKSDSTSTALLVGNTRLSSLIDATLSQRGDELANFIVLLFYAVAIAFLLVAITGLIIGVSMSRSITSAVHSLYEGTQRVMRGDFSHLIHVAGRDQIAELSNSFNTMTQNLERLIAVSKEKERLQTEIEIARGVQDQLYPKAPPVFENLRVLGKCDPARMVSGDYYDYQLVDGKLAIAIGDVAGKGISAALLMATIQAALRMELRASADLSASMNGQRFSTARMVSELNQQLHATTSPEKYATFFFGIYDEQTRLMTYTNAGHLQPVLIRDGAPTLLGVNGLMVGAFPFAKYDESKLELRSGDLLVCYTDGITEPENEYGEMFGEERLIEIVAKNSDRDEAQIIQSVMDSVRQWTSAPELPDDMTVLLARKS